MRDIVDGLAAWQAAGHPFAIATVVQTWKSAPRQAPGGGDTTALFGGSPSTRTCP